MILTKRERYIALGAGSALGLLALSQFAVWPLLDQRADAKSETALVWVKLNESRQTMKAGERAKESWTEMQKKGLSTDVQAAENQFLNTLLSWGRDAGLALSYSPEPVQADKQFLRKSYSVVATGAMASITKFLGRVESASIPVRLTDISLSARQEGGSRDDLTLILRVSTLVIAPEAAKSTKAPSGAKEGK